MFELVFTASARKELDELEATPRHEGGSLSRSRSPWVICSIILSILPYRRLPTHRSRIH